MIGRVLLDELLVALDDEELRGRVRRAFVPIVAEALSQVLAGEYVDKHEAARLGVEWRTLRRSGLPCFHVGRKVVFRRADVVAFVERSVASPPGERSSETRVSAPPETEEDSFQVAVRKAEKRQRATG